MLFGSIEEHTAASGGIRQMQRYALRQYRRQRAPAVSAVQIEIVRAEYVFVGGNTQYSERHENKKRFCHIPEMRPVPVDKDHVHDRKDRKAVFQPELIVAVVGRPGGAYDCRRDERANFQVASMATGYSVFTIMGCPAASSQSATDIVMKRTANKWPQFLANLISFPALALR